jgi:peptide/nickel transport system ATP-binding protein
LNKVLTPDSTKIGTSIVELNGLRSFFYLDEGILKAVNGVTLSVGRNKTLGIIGESGCGKSVTAQSILRIIPHPGRIVSGSILFQRKNGETINIAKLHPMGDEIRNLRGKEISMIFQEPMTSLSPVHTIGRQIMEMITLHEGKTRNEARELAIEMLNRVGISNPSQRVDDFPHQLSGGMRQRAMIAMSLACSPSLLIADEPTTALDVTVQAQILELMKELQDQFDMAILYITHDLGVIADIADEVAVMYLGRVVEQGSAMELFYHPMHPYTRRLLKSIPKLGRKARMRLDAIEGNVPTPLDIPPMCGFFSRCKERIEGRCNRATPSLVEVADGHKVSCFLHSEEEER